MIKKALSIFLIIAVILSVATFPTFATATATVVIYPEYPDIISRDYDYSVEISNGTQTYTIPVYNPTRNIDSFDGVKNTDSYRRFCEFSFEGEVTVTVTSKLPFEKVSLLPSAKGIDFTVNGNKISFTLSNPENLALRLNDDNNTILSIFAESLLEEFVAETKNVLYFDAGLNNLNAEKSTMSLPNQVNDGAQGTIRLSSNTTIYLAPGAVLTSRFYLRDDNYVIAGRGAVLDPHTSRGAFASMFMFHHHPPYNDVVDNITMDGIKILDPHCFAINLLQVNNVNITDVKILGSEISTDGISFYGDNITIDNCYLYASDDTFVVGGNCENVVVKNSTTASSASFTHIHTHNSTADVTYENINIFRMGDFFRNVQANTNSTKTSDYNIKFKNINAYDTLNGGAFMRLQSQGGDGEWGGKNVYFENVALPAGRNIIFSLSSGTVNVEAKNVYIGGELLTSTSQLAPESGYSFASHIAKFNFTFGTAAEAGLKMSVNSVNATYGGDNYIKVGSYQIPYDKKSVATQNGTIYLPANNLLKYLGYDVEVDGNTVTVKNADGVIKVSGNAVNLYGLDFQMSHSAEIYDDCAYIPISFFTDFLNLSVSQDGSNVVVSKTYNGENLVKDGGMENVHNPFLQKDQNGFPMRVYSENWTHYEQCPLYETTDAHSGKTALSVPTYNNGAEGVTQYLYPAIMTYGAGTYRLSAWVKKGSETILGYDGITYDGTKIEMGIVQSGWRIRIDGALIGINDVKEFTLTDTWQKITYDVVIEDPTCDGYDRAFFYLASSEEKYTHILVDDVTVDYVTSISDTADLQNLINNTTPKRDGYLFKGWYDQSGTLYTTHSTVSSTINLHPEFVYLEGFDSEKVEKTQLLAVENGYTVAPADCRLGIHYDKNGTGVEYNVVDSEGDMSVPENKALKNGSFTIPKATTYYSQARYWDGERISSGDLFKSFIALDAPKNYTPKTVALLYNDSEKVYFVPKDTTLYVGDTIIFAPYPEHTDLNPVCENATFINGMYLQGAQARVGGDTTTTGLRFITVNNIKLIELLKANFSNVEYGTLVMSENNFTSNLLTISTPKSTDVKAVKIYHTAHSLGRLYQKYTACVTKIPVAQLKTDVLARPYIKYTDLSNVDRYIYGEQYATDIYDIAVTAYENPNENLEVKNYLFKEIIKKLGIDNDLNIDF